MNDKLTIIAEMACSHDGKIKNAEHICKSAHMSGADAIQLQIWSLNQLMSKKNNLYEKIKKIELSFNAWRKLVSLIRKKYKNLKVYICVYEHQSIDFILSLKPDGIKVNSADLTNSLVLKKIKKFKKNINLSVGASSFKEIDFALNILRSRRKNITLMYGFQSFPTYPEYLNLERIKKLKKKYNLNVGYQDHCAGNEEIGNYLNAYAYGMGATVFERHLTYNRQKCLFDYESALERDEFIKFVKNFKSIEKSTGVGDIKKFNKYEIKYRDFQKKNLVYSKSISKGSKLTHKDIVLFRENKVGICPSKIEQFLGKKLKRSVKIHTKLKAQDFSR